MRRVKRYLTHVVAEPYVVEPGLTLAQARAEADRLAVTGFLVVDPERRLLGLLTARDLLAGEDGDRVEDADDAARAARHRRRRESRSTTARRLLTANRIEKLPLVDDDGRVAGLVTLRDLALADRYPRATRDALGRLRVAAAIGIRGDYLDRAAALVAAEVDALVLDIAHGHADAAIEAVAELKSAWPDVEVVAGNVATGDGVTDLAAAGADAVKVGIGPGLRLHDAARRRRRRAAALGGARLRRRSPGDRRAADRRRRHPAGRARRDRDGRRREHGDGREPVRRARGEPRRRRPPPRPAVQGLPRHGLALGGGGPARDRGAGRLARPVRRRGRGDGVPAARLGGRDRGGAPRRPPQRHELRRRRVDRRSSGRRRASSARPRPASANRTRARRDASATTLYANGFVVTMDDAGTEHESGWLLVDGTTIAAVGSGAEPAAAARVDLRGRGRHAGPRQHAPPPLPDAHPRPGPAGRPLHLAARAVSRSGRGSTPRPSTPPRARASPSSRSPAARPCSTTTTSSRAAARA